MDKKNKLVYDSVSTKVVEINVHNVLCASGPTEQLEEGSTGGWFDEELD